MRGKRGLERLGPGAILVVLLVEFVLLGLLLLGFELGWAGLRALPVVIGGVLPLIVPWAGALGGVCIGLTGVARYWKNWYDNPAESLEWNGWYLIRLPIGAALGTIAALIVVLFTGTIAPSDNGEIDVSPAGAATLAVVAFVVGYEQGTFRQLLERVTRVILGPGEGGADGTGRQSRAAPFTVRPRRLSFAAKVGSTQSRSVAISNGGVGGLPVGADQVTVTGTGFGPAAMPGVVAAGDTGLVTITFTPERAGAHPGRAVITVGDHSQRVELAGIAED